MRHNLRFTGRAGLILALTGLASACSLIPTVQTPPPAKPLERVDPSLTLINSHLQKMERLALGTPAEQAEIFQGAKSAAEITPTTQNRLAYALVLATPNHGAANPELARQQLATLIAAPETLLPAERTLAQVMLQNVEQRLILQTETARLQTEIASLQQRQRNSSANRRQQAETEEENAKLRKALAEAQAKLDEIARIERSMTERKPPKN